MIHANKTNSKEEASNPSLPVTERTQNRRKGGLVLEKSVKADPPPPPILPGMLKLQPHLGAAQPLGQCREKRPRKLKTGGSRRLKMAKQHSTSSHNHMHYSGTGVPPNRTALGG